MTKRQTIEFNHHDPKYRDDWAARAEERASKCPVAWTEAHGGYWVLSGYAEVSRAASDPENFSSSHMDPEKPWAKGILIPELPYPLPLSESDPPVHTARRMVEAPYFAPAALRDLAKVVQQNIDDALDKVEPLGRLNFVYDFAMPVAAKTTMHLVGIDPEQWQLYMMSAHKASVLPADHPDYPLAEIRKVQALLRERLAERKQEPRKDLLSALATRTVLGARLTEAEQVGMLSAAVFGGFGTVMSATLSALSWLENQHEIRPQLLEDDGLLDRFLDEILRLNPPNHGTARNVGADLELGGQQLRKGDRVLLSWAAANRDPAAYECPAEFRLDRANGKDHFSFGGGAHRCLGAPLARVEMRLMIRSVLMRLPDYRIDREAVTHYPSFANTAGFASMPASFTPVSRTGA